MCLNLACSKNTCAVNLAAACLVILKTCIELSLKGDHFIASFFFTVAFYMNEKVNLACKLSTIWIYPFQEKPEICLDGTSINDDLSSSFLHLYKSVFENSTGECVTSDSGVTNDNTMCIMHVGVYLACVCKRDKQQQCVCYMRDK